MDKNVSSSFIHTTIEHSENAEFRQNSTWLFELQLQIFKDRGQFFGIFLEYPIDIEQLSQLSTN